MEQLIWYLRGYVRIRVTGYSPERFLNACRYKNIYIWNLKRICGTYEMNLTIRDFRRLKEIVRKTGTKVCIIRRSGLPFLLHHYHGRHVFPAGILLCACLMFFMTRYIWGIDIKGNLSYTNNTLKKFLASEKIKDGMKKSDVDCQKIVQELRKKYDDIIWVSASVEGCRLIIEIKENEDALTDLEKADGYDADIGEKSTDIVADTDCTVVSITTRTGIPVVQKGSQVKKGELLVSGQIPICNDEKEITGYTACRSDADIYGEMTIPYRKAISSQYIKKEYYVSTHYLVQKKEYCIRINQRYLRIGSTKNSYPFFEKNTFRTNFHPFPIFSFTIDATTVTPYKKTLKNHTKDEICRILSEDFQAYCKEMEKKGVEIIQNDVKIYTGSETYCAKGTLKIRCLVGRQVPSVALPSADAPEEETKNGD